MVRVKEVSAETATAEQAAVLAEDVAAYGDVLNTTRIYAHVPELLKPLRELHSVLAERGPLERLGVARETPCGSDRGMPILNGSERSRAAARRGRIPEAPGGRHLV